MQAEIITVGDEILIGQVTDTNSAWIAQRLNEAGIAVVHMATVADDAAAIREAVDAACRRAGVVILTGGLGPTSDDLTKDVLCAHFGGRLRFDETAFRSIEEKFTRRGLPVTESNRRQAEIPDICKPLYNELGTAPGMWFERDGVHVISLPGVPYEMKAMLAEQVIPALREQHALPVICHKTILTAGIGESLLAERLTAWENSLPSGIRLAYLPSPGMVRLRLTSAGSDESVRRIIDDQVRRLLPLIDRYVYGFDDDTLEAVVGRMLAQRKATLAIAESCTGGFLAHLITTVPGSSDYFLGSVTAYANRIKQEALGVSRSDLDRHGAVSEPVAMAMATGIRERFGATYALATTGIAGPGGGTAGKPVGTIWVALAGPAGTYSKQLYLSGNRMVTIRATSVYLLNRLRLALLDDATGK